MYELHQVGPMSYYLESPAKIGIYRPEENKLTLYQNEG